MNESRILLICPDEGVCQLIRRAVDGVGMDLTAVGTVDDAYNYEGWDRVALVLIYVDHPRSTQGVVRLLRMIAAARRSVATVVLASGLDDSKAAGLLRAGAADLLSQPFDEARLAYLIEVLTLRSRAASVTTFVRPSERDLGDEGGALEVQARRFAGQDATVLITGEAGTGKSRLARLIHELSPRRDGRLVTIRCATVAPDAFEEELLGPVMTPEGPAIEPGGRLGEARGGTILFDDVDTLAPVAQAALHQWIEDGAFRQANELAGPLRLRPRILATSRKPLGESVASGSFRADLFYRLNVIGLELAPLRERRDEIPSLIPRLLDELGGAGLSLSADAVQAIEAYPWPANVRELRDCLESALANVRGPVIGRESLPESLRVGPRWSRPPAPTVHDDPDESLATTLAQTKSDAEFARITEALEKHGHNRLRTANELGISRMTLYKKLYKYGIIEQETREGWFPGGRIPRSSTRPEGPTGARS